MGLPDAEHIIKCVLKQILCIAPERGMTRGSSLASTDSAIALPKDDGTAVSMATEVFKQERALQQENEDLQRQLRENEERLAELRMFSELQDKMAMLALRLDLHTVGTDVKELPKLV
jgi:TolA-binding protein